MSVEEIVKWVGGGIVALATLVQITPIKINPWSTLLNAIGKMLFGEALRSIESHFDKIDKKIDGMEKSISNQKEAFEKRIDYEDESRAKDKRFRILRFGDEVSHGEKHSEEMFNQIMEDISDYCDYCAEHKGFKNKKAEVTIGIIVEKYRICKQNNDFL